MSVPIVVDDARVDEDTLTRLVNDVQRLTGAKVSVRLRSQWVVETDNYPVSLALQTILGGAPETANPAKQHKPSKKQSNFPLSKKGKELDEAHEKELASFRLVTDETQGEYKLTPGEPREIKAWRLLDGNGAVVETLTIEERNKRLAEGGFAEGAILHHPKAGQQRVIGSGPGQGMQPVK